MNHLENLIKQYYEWKGFIVRNNVLVGRRLNGGWECELDIVAYHHDSKQLIHIEPSLDAHTWEKRQGRYLKKFEAGQKYIFTDVFPWINPETRVQKIAILVTSSRKELAGAKVISIDEFVAQVRKDIIKEGVMAKRAIPEKFDLLRTIQLMVSGYYRVTQAEDA